MIKSKQIVSWLSAMILVFTPTFVSAADFEANNDDGKRIFYVITAPDEVAVCSVTNAPDFYTGGIVIPPKVTYMGNTYSVTSIQREAFIYCGKLLSVTLPNTLKYISNAAFVRCNKLREVVWGNSLVSIGENAFDGCWNLTSVDIPNSVTTIGRSAFMDCRELVSVSIPNSVTELGTGVFKDCGALTTVRFSDSITEIGGFLFENCTNLTSVDIPNSVTTIGSCAFRGCSGLKSVTIPDAVTSISDDAFRDCYGMASFHGKYASDDGRCLIDENGGLIAFAPAGLSTYTIPTSCTAINNRVFYGIPNLKSVTIPETVGYIDYYAFSNCSGLKSVEICSSSIYINGNAFENCTEISSVKLHCDNPANIRLGYEVFYRVPIFSCTLYVPKGSKELYETADPWRNFGTIEEFEVEKEEPIFGDISGDGKITISDAVIICNSILKAEYSETADLDGDGKLSISDVVVLINMILETE